MKRHSLKKEREREAKRESKRLLVFDV